MKKTLLIIFIMTNAIYFVSCSKDQTNPIEQSLIGLWECDSTVLDSRHSMMFRAKKYEFLESGRFYRTSPFFFPLYPIYGDWTYDSESISIILHQDTTTLPFPPELQKYDKIDIYLLTKDNLVLIEDYESVYLENGELEYIKEYYTRKK